MIVVSEDLLAAYICRGIFTCVAALTHGRAMGWAQKGIDLKEKDVKEVHKNGCRVKKGFMAGKDRVGVLDEISVKRMDMGRVI